MKKGFTLIELLAVIVILAIIALIATPIVLSIIEDTKESATLRSAEHYLSAVEQSIMKKNLNAGGSFSPNTCEVQSNGSLLCDGTEALELEISGEVPSTGTITFEKGKIIDVDLTLSNKRIIKNSKGEMIHFPCTLISGDKETPGSKYECEVKKGTKYNFYVLSKEEDGTTNLIMDRNICENGIPATEDNKCLVAWVSKLDYKDDTNYGTYGNNNKGPITAMNYLYNATKDWDNIPNIKMDYEDEGKTENSGYGSIKTTNNITKITKKDGSAVTVLMDQEGYTNLKARIPYKRETSDYDKTNAYLYENLHIACYDSKNHMNPVSCDVAGYIEGLYNEGMSHIKGIYGYWILSTRADYPSIATFVLFLGYTRSDSVQFDSHIGVRPVITLKL